VDFLDIGILRVLRLHGHDPRPSYAEAARSLGVDEDTVRARLRTLEDIGVLTGWEVLVNPAAFGRTAARIEVQPRDSRAREAALAEAQRLDGAYMVWDLFQAEVAVGVLTTGPSHLEECARRMQTAAGTIQAWTFPIMFPPASSALDATDAACLLALRHGPRRPIPELAREAGLGQRTFRRRMEQLIKGRMLSLSVSMDFARMRGLLPCEGRVPVSDEAARARIHAIVQGLRGLVVAFPGPVLVFAAGVENLAELEELAARLRAVSPDARVDLVRSRMVPPDWIDAQMRRIAAGP
jgi:DNA-binding Lrp family transcriptional regulator